MDQVALQKAVLEKLSKVIDPETGADVIRMKLVLDLMIDEKGKKPPTPFGLLHLYAQSQFHSR